jgi:hypothetical protein
MKTISKKITTRAGKIDNYQYVVLQPYQNFEHAPHGNHYCAYVGLPKDHPMFFINHNVLYDIGLYHPNVNGGLTFSGVPNGLEGKGLTYYGWDYNHSFNKIQEESFSNTNLIYHSQDWAQSGVEHMNEVEWIAEKRRESNTPSESIVMIDIRNCIDWIKECTEKLERNEVSHQDCPRCNSLAVYSMNPKWPKGTTLEETHGHLMKKDEDDN